MQGGCWKREKFTLAVPSLSVSGQLLISQELGTPFSFHSFPFYAIIKGTIEN